MALTNISITMKIYGVRYVNRELDRCNVNTEVNRLIICLITP